jgi:hypothetical protein
VGFTRSIISLLDRKVSGEENMRKRDLFFIIYILVTIAMLIFFITKKEKSVDTDVEQKIIKMEEIKIAESIKREDSLKERYVDETAFKDETGIELLDGIRRSCARLRSTNG